MAELSWSEGLALTLLIFAAAVLYSSIGHAGASGYLAAMSLFGLAPEQMKPAALTLNIAVATLGTWRYIRAGCFQPRIWLLFTVFSLPCAAIGGYLTLPGSYYKPIVGLVLWWAAVRFLLEPYRERRSDADAEPQALRPLPWPAAAIAGGGIGLLSGLTGTGGGIFLSPLILFMRWATTRQTSGIAVAFILANSLAGLGGLLSRGGSLPPAVGWWLAAVLSGAWLGTTLGIRRLRTPTLRQLLGVVLVIAGGKMVLADAEWWRLIAWRS